MGRGTQSEVISRNQSQSVAISRNQSQSARSPDPATECNGSAQSPPRASPRNNERNVHRPRPCHLHQGAVPPIGPRHGSRRRSPSNPPDEGCNHRATHLMRDAIRGPSEVITEALRGNSEALIRGTHQRHSSEALIRGTQSQSELQARAAASTVGRGQAQSVAIRRNQNLKRELQLRLWGEGKRNQSQSVAIRTSSASCSFDPKPHSRNSPLPPNVTIHLPLARGCSMAAASM